jgi:hypothetical protein
MSMRRLSLCVSACSFVAACNDGGVHASGSGFAVATVTMPGIGTSGLPTSGATDGPGPASASGSASAGTDAMTDADNATTTPADPTLTGSTDGTGMTGLTGVSGMPDMPVTTGTTGAMSTSGAPLSCGDAMLDPGEECDNGEQNGPDQPCYADCTINHCGDGISELPEECDLGGLNGPDSGCSPLCKVLPSACGTQTAEAQVTIKPVDIIVVIDNSGSMSAEIAGVESNINNNFADILAASGLDYRVIMVSAFGKNLAYKVCIEAPLGGIPPGGCVEPPDQPVNNPGKFYHYSTPISSVNAACRALSTFDGVDPDQFGLAPTGWQAWLRQEALKVFLVITDDQMACSYDEKTYDDKNKGVQAVAAATSFDASMLAKSPLHFGTTDARNYLWYSIVGMANNAPPDAPYTPLDPLISNKCKSAVNAGIGYQALSSLTSAWRFPLCETTKYDQIFEGIAMNVVAGSKIACNFMVPAAPEGKSLDEDSVVVSVTPKGEKNPVMLDQVPGLDMCTPMAFYVDADQVILCPEACAALQNDKDAEIEVEFTCEPLVPN